MRCGTKSSPPSNAAFSLYSAKMETISTLALNLLAAALLLAFARLVRGPSLPDRVVALDLISIIIAGMIAAYAVRMHQLVLLDAVTVMAVISFFGTVALARCLERRRTDES